MILDFFSQWFYGWISTGTCPIGDMLFYLRGLVFSFRQETLHGGKQEDLRHAVLVRCHQLKTCEFSFYITIALAWICRSFLLQVYPWIR